VGTRRDDTEKRNGPTMVSAHAGARLKPLVEMSAEQRREFHNALLDADSFEDLPRKWQAAISRPKTTGRSCGSPAVELHLPEDRLDGRLAFR
jgi:hypothetical protein